MTLSLTRYDVPWNASLQTDLQWNYTAANSDAPTGATRPAYLGTSYGPKMGVPYCWGGFNGSFTHSANAAWTNFTDAMSKSALAVNINCTGPWISGTAGFDCSGFVSACYRFTTKKIPLG